jgi:uncharacterized protein
MRVFSISDLHLSADGQKPMDMFGPDWVGHREKVAANWRRIVAPDDLVLLCGDLSWAMRLDDALPDLHFIESLPGTKYFIRGNHDYWYSSPGKVRAVLGPSLHTLRFDAAVVAGVGICGVRGWAAPGSAGFDPEADTRYWLREVARLRLSLDALAALDWDVAVAMFHHPPAADVDGSEMTRMVAEAGVRHCVYGHIHATTVGLLPSEIDGVSYRCTSADLVAFTPVLVL